MFFSTLLTLINSYLTLARRSRKHELSLLLMIPYTLLIPGHATIATWLWLGQGGVKGAQGERVHRVASAWLPPEHIIQLLSYYLDVDLPEFKIWSCCGKPNPKQALSETSSHTCKYVTLSSQSCGYQHSAFCPVNRILLAKESCQNSSWRMLTWSHK